MPFVHDKTAATERHGSNDYGVPAGFPSRRTGTGLSVDSDYQSILAGKLSFFLEEAFVE